MKKVFRLPEDMHKRIEGYYGGNGYRMEEIDLNRLADEDGLNRKGDLETYHTEEWGTDPSRYSFDEKKIGQWGNSVPHVVKDKFGKLRLSDGRHRTKALLNGGYTHAVFPYRDEEAEYKKAMSLMGLGNKEK